MMTKFLVASLYLLLCDKITEADKCPPPSPLSLSFPVFLELVYPKILIKRKICIEFNITVSINEDSTELPLLRGNNIRCSLTMSTSFSQSLDKWLPFTTGGHF